MDNLPVCKKCCFCVPLRYGLLMWGYLKLFSEILLLTILGLIAYAINDHLRDERGIVALVFATLSVEIIIQILFIIGSHNKNVNLLKVYYYYAIFMWAVTLSGAVVSTVLIIVAMSVTSDGQLRITLLLVNCFTFAFALAMQTFLLFVLRSEIIKLRSNCPYRYVKGTEDSEGVIKAEEESEDKTTQLIDENETSRC